jgi:hypothetical protein
MEPSSTASTEQICLGCGACFLPIDGPVHAYMTSSPACFAAFSTMLAAEYSDPALLQTHRLTVDTYAVQHPGNAADRRAVQSVGLHLARLYVQLESEWSPPETNAVMLDFSQHKSSLVALDPPSAFRMTIADVLPACGLGGHAEIVRKWAKTTWADCALHHRYIADWVGRHSKYSMVVQPK